MQSGNDSWRTLGAGTFVGVVEDTFVVPAAGLGVAYSKAFVCANKVKPVAGRTNKTRMTLIVREGWWIGFISSNTCFFLGFMESDSQHFYSELTHGRGKSFTLNRRCFPETIRNRNPFRRVRRSLDHDQGSSGFVAPVEFGVNRARKCRRIVRDDADPPESFR